MNEFFAFVGEHKWILLQALAIGWVVRFLKSGHNVPAVPRRWRPWLALVLGVLSAILRIMWGVPCLAALSAGLLAAIFAISGHELFVESLRGGRELFARALKLPAYDNDGNTQ